MRNFFFAAAICCALTFSLSAQEEEKVEETKESKVEAEAPSEGEAEAEEEEEDKLAFERKPYFNATVFGGVSAGINIEDGDVNKEESYEIGLDNLILDFQGGDRMFNGRAMVDFGSVDDEGKMTLDVIKNVSFRMQHPSFRNKAGTFGLDVNLQAGLFEMPFGIETGYDHEVAFANSAIKDDFFGGAFNDLGVSLGVDLIFSKESDLAITLFAFNGANETMLDGEENLFRAPAFGADIRFNKTGDFYATAVASLVVGKAYRNYGFDVYNVENDEIASYKNGESLDQDKNNVLMAIGADLGYNVNDNISIGFKGEFGLSHRALYNPDFENGKLISDGVDKAGSSYTSWGIFAMPYATLWDIDMMARVSYFKAPFYDATIASKDDSNLGVNIAVIYNFCDYAGIELDYDFNKTTFHGYGEKNDTVSESINSHSIALALSGAFDFLWEESKEDK